MLTNYLGKKNREIGRRKKKGERMKGEEGKGRRVRVI
jgi:hypothetical protein